MRWLADVAGVAIDGDRSASGDLELGDDVVVEKVVEASGHGIAPGQAPLQFGIGAQEALQLVVELGLRHPRAPHEGLLEHDDLGCPDAGGKEPAEGPDVLGVEFRRIERAEHCQETGVSLLMLGERVAAGSKGVAGAAGTPPPRSPCGLWARPKEPS